MHMVIHEDVGMHRAGEFPCQAGKLGQIKVPIVLREEAWLPVVPSLNDVGWNPCKQGTKTACHDVHNVGGAEMEDSLGV